MKIACPKCNAQYNIPDEKIPSGKKYSATCKKCGDRIVYEPEPARHEARNAPEQEESTFQDMTRRFQLDYEVAIAEIRNEKVEVEAQLGQLEEKSESLSRKQEDIARLWEEFEGMNAGIRAAEEGYQEDIKRKADLDAQIDQMAETLEQMKIDAQNLETKLSQSKDVHEEKLKSIASLMGRLRGSRTERELEDVRTDMPEAPLETAGVEPQPTPEVSGDVPLKADEFESDMDVDLERLTAIREEEIKPMGDLDEGLMDDLWDEVVDENETPQGDLEEEAQSDFDLDDILEAADPGTLHRATPPPDGLEVEAGESPVAERSGEPEEAKPKDMVFDDIDLDSLLEDDREEGEELGKLFSEAERVWSEEDRGTPSEEKLSMNAMEPMAGADADEEGAPSDDEESPRQRRPSLLSYLNKS